MDSSKLDEVTTVFKAVKRAICFLPFDDSLNDYFIYFRDIKVVLVVKR